MGSQAAVAVPFWYSSDINAENGARVLMSQFAFNTSQAAIQGQTLSLADVGLYTVQYVWIDNSASPSATSILLSGTRQVVTAPPYAQGYYRVLGSPLMLDYTVQNFGGVTAAGFAVTLGWINVELDAAALVWSVQPPGGLQGTPFIASAVQTAAPATVTMPAVVGRRSFIDTIHVSGTGATAAAEVTATLTNMESVGVATTLNWAFTAPLGVGVPASPLIISFDPPAPVLSGSAAVLTLPSLTAGGMGAVVLQGFYV